MAQKMIRLTESQIRGMIREKVLQYKQQLNEGPGAGYTVSVEPLYATNFRLKRWADDSMGFTYAIFTAKIKPSDVNWTAENYYEAYSSEDFGPSRVEGGELEGMYCFNARIPEDEALEAIQQDMEVGFEARSLFGGGYSHVYLESEIAFRDEIEVGGDIVIDKLVLVAPELAQDINDAFNGGGGDGDDDDAMALY